MTEAQIREEINDRDALAVTMHCEAAGDSRDGSSLEERAAVGCVIRNRLRLPLRFGDSYKEVCLKDRQFSCWIAIGGIANYQRTLHYAYLLVTKQPLHDALFEETLWLSEGVMGGLVVDQVRGATHYMTRALFAEGTVTWAKNLKPAATIGSQVFFAGVH